MKRHQQLVRVDNEQHDALKTIHEKHGIPIAESVRRAIKSYLQTHEFRWTLEVLAKARELNLQQEDNRED